MTLRHFASYGWAASPLIALAMLPVPAFAATLTVTTNAESTALDTDDCTANSCTTLRAAINHAAKNNNADIIVFDAALDGQTITLSSYTNCLTTSDSGSNSANAPCLPPASGSADNGWPGSPAFVSQFGPSAFFIHGKTLTIDATANGMIHGVVIARDVSADSFRLFDVDSGSNLFLRGLTLRDGKVEGGYSGSAGGGMGAGGAIFNQGTLSLKQCTLAANSADGGRGSVGPSNTGGGGVGQSGRTFVEGMGGGGPNAGNDAGGGDGGFGGGGGSHSGNGGFGGGGSYGGNGGFGAGAGGAISTYNGFGGGPGPVIYGGAGGAGGGLGGALFNDAGSVSLVNTTFAKNQATGGRAYENFSYNGSGYGGAIFNYNGNLNLDHVTLTDNRVAPGTNIGAAGNADGGAIYSLGDSLAQCSAGGNICNRSSANLVMNRSIAAGSSGGTGTVTHDVITNAIHGGGNDSSGDDNLIGSQTGFDGNAISSTAPQLGVLATTFSGGLVDVMVPQRSSPVIDAANACGTSSIDQRGIARPQGSRCDIGAVEVGLYTLTVGLAGPGSVSAGTVPAPASGGVPACSAAGGSHCTANYMPGDEVNLVATANTGAHFVSWTGACSGTASTSISMDGDKLCVASFVADADHSIGGTLNGLTGTGLELQLNGSNTLPINPNDTSFVFTSGLLAYGQSYVVTVSATGQPTAPAQTCTVSNGTGSMPDADVTNMVVNCTTNRYTISGTVTNLTGSGLALKLNGGPGLPVTGNFTFATLVASGASYAVNVATQPTSPIQTCSVGNANGMVANADVSNVTVTCNDATPILSLSIDDGHDFARYGLTLDYLVTLDNTGNATASNVALSSISNGLDSAVAHWLCIGANNGATCTTSNTGPFADTATIPAGRSLSWLVTVPVLANAPGESVEMSVQATNASSATDVDTLVVFRDGFDVVHADGTRAVTPAPDSAGVLCSDGSDTFPVPPATSNRIDTIKTLRDGDATIKVQRLVLHQNQYVRLLQHPRHGEESTSAWVPVAANATLSIGSVADKLGDRIVLLEGAAQPSSLLLTH